MKVLVKNDIQLVSGGLAEDRTQTEQMIINSGGCVFI